jgi:hypothetical protein
MIRILAAPAVAYGVWLAVVAPRTAAAQGWNEPSARALVERATARRAQQFADTALVDYRARAHGYLTFLAQVGEGFTEPPRLVKADELALEVYWRPPDLSKQVIIGQRDTLLLPTDIDYHRDHLGIVQNNFPGIIRLGEGDEVRDVPHPLSPTGLREYDFAISDSLQIRLPDRVVDVYEVRVRPRDDQQPRVIGAVYLDRATGEVVRMAFNFTRAAFVDRQLDDLSVVLENALVGGRFWLPRQQEIEIRRSGRWLDYPARGIIRGRWEICCYDINVGLDPALFAGPEIVLGPADVRSEYEWSGRILDSLPPDVRAVSDAEVRRVQEEARELVRAQALARVRGASLAARRLSDFARVNRAEGLALGGTALFRLGAGVDAAVGGRWGFSDDEAKGGVALTGRRAGGAALRVFAERTYRDARDVMETSLVRNSLAAQELGSDYTEPYDVRRGGVSSELGTHLGLWWRVEAAYEHHERLTVEATPATGRYEPIIPAWSLRVRRLSIGVERPTALGPFGTELRLLAELRGALFDGRDTVLSAERPYLGRVFLAAHLERPIGPQRLVLHTIVGAVGAVPDVPPQDLVYFGGPVTAPGYEFQDFAGQVGVSQRVEWQSPVPFPSIPLGRFGDAPASATVAPFAHAVYLRHPAPFRPEREGWYPSVGVGVLMLFDLLRFDVARGLRDGRWTLSVDVSRDFWSIL